MLTSLHSRGLASLQRTPSLELVPITTADIFLQKVVDWLHHCRQIWNEHPDIINHSPNLLKLMDAGRCRHVNNGFHLGWIWAHTIFAKLVPQKSNFGLSPYTLLQIQLKTSLLNNVKDFLQLLVMVRPATRMSS